METTREVQCQSCNRIVTHYEHRTQFTFIDGERVTNGHYASLGCGCEVMGYELDFNHALATAEIIDPFRKITVLTFVDEGPYNEILNQDDGCGT